MPKAGGISYSFTNDGFFETSTYTYTSNRECARPGRLCEGMAQTRWKPSSPKRRLFLHNGLGTRRSGH